VAALSQWVYGVKHISTKKRQEVHAKALRFYHDPSLNVELSVKEQLASDEARVYEVEEIEDVKKRWEKWMLLVKWKDYDVETWEEARQLHQDVPDLINAYMNEKMAESKRPYIRSTCSIEMNSVKAVILQKADNDCLQALLPQILAT
jgi:hypothetical protein